MFLFLWFNNNKFLQMSTLLCLERKIGGSRSGLWAKERLRYQVTERE